MKKTELLMNIGCVTIATIAIGILIGSWLLIPVVYTSHSTGECVSVDNPQYSCDDLPKKYINGWSK